MIHIRALTNLAWLKAPFLCKEFKVEEVIALCSAALRPTPETWRRTIKALKDLVAQEKMGKDEAVSLLLSRMTEDTLVEIDLDSPDPASNIELVEMVRAKQEHQHKTELGEVVSREAEQRRRAEEAIREKEEADLARRVKVNALAYRAAEVIVSSLFGVGALGVLVTTAMTIVGLAHFNSFLAGAASFVVIVGGSIGGIQSFGSLRVWKERATDALASQFEMRALRALGDA